LSPRHLHPYEPPKSVVLSIMITAVNLD